jgi:8-oxo-dGTP pyrophosphatase MutT (NUDIX family)
MSKPLPPDWPHVIPAATLVVFRKGRGAAAPELLMVQRAREMRFAGGAAVFPGGRIDTADYELAARIAPHSDNEVAAAQVASIRETLEETGLVVGLSAMVTAQDARDARAMLLEHGALAPVLERFGWTPDLSALVPFAHWCPRWPGAFDTRFFLADLGTGEVDVAVDATENTRLFWASAADVIARDREGDVSVIFPTLRNLERLAQFTDFAEAVENARAHPVERIAPIQEERDGEVWLLLPEGYGYPVRGQTLASAKIARPKGA